MGGAVAVAVTHWPGTGHPAAQGLADAVRAVGSGAPASGPAPAGHVNAEWLRDVFAEPASAAPHARHPQEAKASPEVSRTPAAPPPVYRNPFRAVTGLRPERVDMGADFGGSGPVYALGQGVITSATGDSAGWPGGGWITYRLTAGPAAGLSVYVAEDVTPAVQVGQEVSSGTVVANMFDGSAGIETGWAQPGGASAESQLAEAGGISGGGPFPTRVGLSFDELLQALGVPAGSNAADAASGLLPAGYPAAWSAATLRP